MQKGGEEKGMPLFARLLRFLDSCFSLLCMLCSNVQFSVPNIFLLVEIWFCQARLSNAAAEGVSKLLPKSAENELASQCSWPDAVRKEFPWSSALHFADTPDTVCSYDHTSMLLSSQSQIFCSFINLRTSKNLQGNCFYFSVSWI